MAWTVEDCAYLLQAMAGHDPADPASAPSRDVDYVAGLDRGVKGLRIGWRREWFTEAHPVGATTLAALEQAAGRSGSWGRWWTTSCCRRSRSMGRAGSSSWVTEAYAAHEPWMRTRFNDYGSCCRDRMAFGALVSGADYVQAVRKRRELCAGMARRCRGMILC